VNQEVLQYYWELGRDIVEMHAESRWGQSVIKSIAIDLKRELPNAIGLSQSNLYYAKKFYLLYHQFVPQLAGKCDNNTKETENEGDIIFPQVVGKLQDELFSIPWGHHRLIMDKCSDSYDI
jgi:hypothetical protein